MSFKDSTSQHSVVQSRDQVISHLFLTHQHRLRWFVQSRIGEADESVEIVQQAFAEAYRVYDSFRGESGAHTWLYSIANNLVRNHLSRSPSRRYAFEDESVLETHAGPASLDPCEQLCMSQGVALLDDAMSHLPKDLRDTLLLVCLDELSYAEAAEQLNVPVGTVRSRVSRARASLRQSMCEGGFEPAC